MRRLSLLAGVLAPPRGESARALAMRAVVAVDGIGSPSNQTSTEFLLSRPVGAYTTARTCSGARRIFEWDTHVFRTAASAAKMIRSSPDPDIARDQALLSELGTVEQLQPRIELTVRAAFRKYFETYSAGDELKVTILVTWPGSWIANSKLRGSVACHLQPLPAIRPPPIRVEVRGSPRSNAAAKSSSWVSDRACLEALKREDIDELVLMTDSGDLLEGSQTNVSHRCELESLSSPYGALSAHASHVTWTFKPQLLSDIYALCSVLRNQKWSFVHRKRGHACRNCAQTSSRSV